MSLKLRRGLESQRTTITPEEGEIIYTTDDKLLYVGDGETPGGLNVSAPVSSVNNQIGAVELTTDEIEENTNLYFTTERARDSLSAGTGISYSAETGVIASSITQYTDALARDAVSGGTGISYDSETGVITCTVVENDNYATIQSKGKFLVTNVTAGSDYTATPSVTIVPGVGDTTGNSAVGQVKLLPTFLTGITIVNPGSGYTIAPTIQFSDGGDGAVLPTATCTISGGAINSVTITYKGLGLTKSPTITLSGGGGGSNGSLRAVLNGTGIADVIITNYGADYTVAPTITVVPGAGDTTGYGSVVTTAHAPALTATNATDTFTVSAGPSNNVIVYTVDTPGDKRLSIEVKNRGEVLPAAAGNLPFYGTDSNTLIGARGLAWTDNGSLFQVGSEAQGVNGNMRIVRNNYSAAAGNGFIFEQYHSTQDTVNFNFLRGRGTQNSPAAVTTSDKLGDIGFGGYDNSGTPGAVFGGQITARVDGTVAPTKMPVRLEFYTRNETESVASAALFLYGNKTATFFGPVHLHRYTTAQRDAIPGLGSGTVGYIIYNTDLNKFQGYQNTGGSVLEWVDLS